jgi:hypothetical protein
LGGDDERDGTARRRGQFGEPIRGTWTVLAVVLGLVSQVAGAGAVATTASDPGSTTRGATTPTEDAIRDVGSRNATAPPDQSNVFGARATAGATAGVGDVRVVVAVSHVARYLRPIDYSPVPLPVRGRYRSSHAVRRG